ncbi:hypothetical protein TA3x_000029 [Tundrisphaera sp. TA3]|uniref:hypothetical protein n=1 Tax=Tundrisphaera sp. TA3 TaxID=3435775 RepID=UPI003EBF8801
MSKGPDPGRPAAIPPAWPGMVACLAASAWIGLGPIHRGHHADSLIPVLASLQRWTPFYWEQDRFGMLVPLLALPIRDPMANLLAQGCMTVAGGLAAFFLLARFVARDASYPMAAALAASAFVLLAPELFRFEYLIDQPYGVGLSLALLGLILAEPGRGTLPRAGGLALMLLAHWVNCATAVYLAPLVAARGALGLLADPGPTLALARRIRARWERGRLGELDVGHAIGAGVRWMRGSETAVALVLLAVGYAAGAAMMGLVTVTSPTNAEALPPRRWPEAWWRLAGQMAIAQRPGTWPLAFGGAGMFGLAAWAGSAEVRRRSPGVIRGAAALLISAVASWLLIGTRSWVAGNGYDYRYTMVATIQIQAACWLVAAAPLRAWPGDARLRRWAVFAAPALLVLASAARDGRPSPARVRADFDRRYGAMTADLLDAGCTHLAGTYWTVWPVVFHANVVLRDRGSTRKFWGATYRASSSPNPANRDVPREEAVIAIPADERGSPAWLGRLDYEPVEEIAGRPTIRVFRPIPRPRAGRSD